MKIGPRPGRISGPLFHWRKPESIETSGQPADTESLAIARGHPRVAEGPKDGFLPTGRPLRLANALAPALAVALTALACGHQKEIALSGFVQDPSGSRVPHSHVLITDAETGITEATTAGADGAFRIGGLAPSPSYQIEVRGPVGFEPHSQSLDLRTDQHLDVMLRIGPVVEAIVISGQRPQPESGQPRCAAKENPCRRERSKGEARSLRIARLSGRS